MKLYCMRHGEAQPAELDPQCGLSPTGTKQVKAVALQLQSQQIDIPRLFYSGKARARQTAQIIGDTLRIEQQFEQDDWLRPDVALETILERLQSLDQDTLLVGHLPIMAHLVSALVTGERYCAATVNFMPATLVCLEYYENSRWIINWVIRPDIVLSPHD